MSYDDDTKSSTYGFRILRDIPGVNGVFNIHDFNIGAKPNMDMIASSAFPDIGDIVVSFSNFPRVFFSERGGTGEIVLWDFADDFPNISTIVYNHTYMGGHHLSNLIQDGVPTELDFTLATVLELYVVGGSNHCD